MLLHLLKILLKNETHWQIPLNRVASKLKARKFKCLRLPADGNSSLKKTCLKGPTAQPPGPGRSGRAARAGCQGRLRATAVGDAVSHCCSKGLKFESCHVSLTKSSHLNRSGLRASTIWTTISLKNTCETCQSL